MLNSQNARDFFLLTLNNLFTKSENVAAKKLCGGVDALKRTRKLICRSSFCNLANCRTQISNELGCTKEIYLNSLSRAILQISTF